MSSQDNHASSGEVLLSNEAQTETDLTASPKWDESPAPDIQNTENIDQASGLNGHSAADEHAPEQQTSEADEAGAANDSTARPESAPEASPESEALENAEAEANEAAYAESLMESIDSAPALAVGELVRGQVVKITDDEVLVDVGLKSEAVIPRSEFLSQEGNLSVAAGDSVEVVVEHFDGLTGTAKVSYRRAQEEKLWEEVERAFHEEQVLTGRVIERIKGGLVVDIGVRAFLPGSQADLRQHPGLEEFMGQEITCKVIKLNRKRNNVVVSRRKALEEETAQKKSELLGKLAEGVVLTGRIKNLADYGAFVDLGGIDGLLHLSDISWGRLTHPSEAVQVGQEVTVQVLKFDREKERVSLSMKHLTADPWEEVAARHRPGDRLRGSVISLTDYGAFVEIEPGVEGLIHISEMSWSNRLRHPSKILKPGELVDVVVLDVNKDNRRISLSLKQTLANPWTDLTGRLGVGTVVQGRVRHFTEFGAFVEVEDGVEGLIHVSNLSWTRNVKHPSEVLHKGQQIEAVVLNIDPEKRRLSLGLKQLQPDAWEDFFNKTSVGSTVRAKITRRTSFGVFAEIEEGIEGLCHISEIGDVPGGEQGLPKVGTEHEFRVIRLNPEEKKIGLSMKAAALEPVAARPAQPASAGLSAMAQAFSSAGITTPAMRQSAGESEKSR